MKHILQYSLLALLVLTVNTVFGQKTYRVTAEQQLVNGKLQIDFYIVKLSGADFVLSASNFSVFVTGSNLNMAAAAVDHTVDGPWDLQTNPGNFYDITGGAGANQVNLNINSITNSFGTPNAKVTFTPQRLGRLVIPIINPNGTNNMSWNLAPIELHDWAAAKIKPKGEFVVNAPSLLLKEPAPFPLELLSFYAEWKDNAYDAADVKWVAYTKPTHLYYELERSANNTDWQSIVKMDAKVSAQGFSQYDHEDRGVAKIRSDIFYYRLKLTEANGKVEYSNVIELSRPTDGSLFKAMPNPVVRGKNITVNFSANSLLSLDLVSSVGILLKSYSAADLKDKITLEIPTEYLAAGTYILTANTRKRSENIKIVVLKE